MIGLILQITKYDKEGYKHSVPVFLLQFVAFQASSALQSKHVQNILNISIRITTKTILE